MDKLVYELKLTLFTAQKFMRISRSLTDFVMTKSMRKKI